VRLEGLGQLKKIHLIGTHKHLLNIVHLSDDGYYVVSVNLVFLVNYHHDN
jgi:hypothetical protein